MKKIIKNREYNTDTAKLVVSVSSKSLYKKRTGEYFMYDNNNIHPLSYEESKIFLKVNAPNVYSREFARIEDGKKTISISISKKALAKVKNISSRGGKAVSLIIEELINAEEETQMSKEEMTRNEIINKYSNIIIALMHEGIKDKEWEQAKEIGRKTFVDFLECSEGNQQNGYIADMWSKVIKKTTNNLNVSYLPTCFYWTCGGKDEKGNYIVFNA